MTSPPFRLALPACWTSAVIFASPHSGRDYTDAFLAATVLDQRQIRTSEDAYVDDLLEGVTSLGVPFLAATAPRAFVDLNRAADELDPAVISDLANGAHNPRILSGLGVIPRVVARGAAIYRGKITLAEAQSRLRDYWVPYHDQLRRLMAEAQDRFGRAILVDMHSMPREAMEGAGSRGWIRPDVVIGDRFGSSASAEVVAIVEAAFRDNGFRVARNTPFAGAYIAQTYGCPTEGRHAVQIELDRSLYMDERLIEPLPDFRFFRDRLRSVLATIAAFGQQDRAMAAE